MKIDKSSLNTPLKQPQAIVVVIFGGKMLQDLKEEKIGIEIPAD